MFVWCVSPPSLLSWMLKHDFVNMCVVFDVLSACVLRFGICTCSALLSTFHAERHSRHNNYYCCY